MNLEKYQKKFNDELFNNVIPFWINNAIDHEHGGIYNSLDRYGKIYSTDKSVWMQGRCAYMFSYLYNNLKKEQKYLEIAKSCLDFLEQHCIDSDKRMFFSVTAEGKPLRKRRYWFSESFYIIACAEYYKATKDQKYKKIAKEYYDFIWGINSGEIEDPYFVTPKVYANTRNIKSLACPMILLNVTHIMREIDVDSVEQYDNRACALLEEIENDFYKPSLHVMLETVGQKGEVIDDVASCRVVNPGHDIECAWFILDEAEYFKSDKLTLLAKIIFDDAIKNGWDEKYGGIKYFIDYKGFPVEAYEHDMKLWWPHNEATIAALKLYKTFGDKKYLKWFEKIVKYEFKHFSDSQYGEWFGYLRRDGKPTQPPCKGHMYKGPFHVLRMLAKCLQLLDNKTNKN
ncbi:MAG: AGE family epimerase/isomerase [Clostridia bacterium]|nr:AGE family epimerase/isomerase [Clostridia bacterium]